MLQKCRLRPALSPNVWYKFQIGDLSPFVFPYGEISLEHAFGNLRKTVDLPSGFSSLSSLSSKVLALLKNQGSCGSPWFLLFFGVSGWKEILEFLIIFFDC